MKSDIDLACLTELWFDLVVPTHTILLTSTRYKTEKIICFTTKNMTLSYNKLPSYNFKRYALGIKVIT